MVGTSTRAASDHLSARIGCGRRTAFAKVGRLSCSGPQWQDRPPERIHTAGSWG